jgi:hypothetical protein
MTRQRSCFQLRAALLTLLLVATAPAQSLRDLLPADAVVVLGIEGGAGAAERLTPLTDPWTGVTLEEGLLALLGLAGGSFGDRDALATIFDLDPQTLLGEAAYLVVSVNPFNPFPALTLLAQIDEATSAHFDALLAQALATGARAQREGAIDFVLVGPEVLGWPFAAVRDGDLLALSSNPDALRAVLRRRQGSSEPNLLQSPGASHTLAHLGDGVLLAYLDPFGLARAITPIATGLGFDRSVQRLLQALRTAGPVAGVLRLEAESIVTHSLQRIDDERGDRALQDLLRHTPLSLDAALRYLPEHASSVSLQPTDPQGAWAYLTLLARELPELGVPDLGRTIRDLFGIDLATSLFAWTTPGLVSVQLPTSDADPLGGQVFGLRTRDEAAAQRGLQTLTQELGGILGLFTNPFNFGNRPPGRELSVAGVRVRVDEITSGVVLASAVHDGWVWLATSEAALVTVLRAGIEGDGSDSPLARALQESPADAHGRSASTTGLAFSSLTELLFDSAPLLLGTLLGGDLNPADLQRLEGAVQGYLETIAPRIGAGRGWSRIDSEGRVERVSITALDLD